MIPQFALRLVCGLGITWCLMPRGLVTTGFFRIQMLVALGLSALACVTAPQAAAVVAGDAWLNVPALVALSAACGAAAFVGSVLWTLARRTAGAWCCVAVTVLSLAALLGTIDTRGGEGAASFWGMALNEVSAAWLLGAAVSAMLLGHWHLTATSMSLKPLARLTLLLAGAALLRGVVALAGWLALGEGSGGDLHRVWLLLRWAAGIVGPLVLSGMVWRILKYRNTQSATGVLFAAVILVFIGETAAALLSRELRWPL